MSLLVSSIKNTKMHRIIITLKVCAIKIVLNVEMMVLFWRHYSLDNYTNKKLLHTNLKELEGRKVNIFASIDSGFIYSNIVVYI